MNTPPIRPPELIILDTIISDVKGACLFFAIILALVLLSMGTDFILGTIKSKLAGYKVQSFKMRKSLIKFITYVGSLLMVFCCDLIFILCDTYETPYVSMVIGACLVIIEVKSWFENLDDKEQARIEGTAKIIASALQQVAPNLKAEQIVEAISKVNDSEETEQ